MGNTLGQCSTSIPPDYLTKTNGFLKFSGDFERDISLKFNFQTYAKSLVKKYQILFGKIVQIPFYMRNITMSGDFEDIGTERKFQLKSRSMF